ncbi:MFS transporter [Bartonella tamiae]|uniref:Major facilitator superfamily (MFS) profile domain-containing protein n=1 Tax=Bartonella tamiae Th239 TaxID=1094558 RepID=J1JWI1_9HYPH|nr:MFS transporter [Bartonella tamiae]EJF88920.1 hypothetical protein ME5_01471 [Bartonella tamiae Th239]EJF94830.1 hypothetical protein MEG_00411 [Bartonella tamiae Th307]
MRMGLPVAEYEINKINPANDIDPRSRRIAMFALAVGGFSIGTAEFVAMGLQPEMAVSTNVDIPTAGQYISAYALGVVVGAPVLAVATAKLSRKFVLIALMLCYALFNAASAFATNFDALVTLRFISGLPHGIYFGVAAIAAASMVEVKQRAKAVGSVVLGLTVATVVGAPLATWIGQQIGWESAFIIVGGIALLTALLIWRFLPYMPTAIGASPLTELGALKQKQVWLLLATVSIGSAGLFTVFTYIKSILMEVSGVSIGWVPLIMPLLGIGMVAGNIFGPRLAIRFGGMRTIFFAMLWSSFAFFLFFFLSRSGITAAIGCFLVGTAFASMPSIQTRIMDVAGKAQTLAGALVQSAFNVANALGAESGATLLKMGYHYQYTALLASGLTFTGLMIFTFSWYLEKRDQSALK